MDPIPDDPSIPEPLRHALHSSQPTPALPRDLDDSILADARAHFARHNRFRRLARWTIPLGAAAAAAIAGAVVHVANRVEDQPNQTIVASSIPNDLNADGRVDILDAMLLARQADSKRAPVSSDLNHDGRVDRADADVLAMSVVTLPQEVVR